MIVVVIIRTESVAKAKSSETHNPNNYCLYDNIISKRLYDVV